MSFATSPIDSRMSRLPDMQSQARQEKSAADWLSWLSALLVDVKSMFLLDQHIRQLTCWPTSIEEPDGALQLALQALSANQVIRSRLTHNSDQVLLAIPLKPSKNDSGTVLLLSCLKGPAEQQHKLVQLVRWASAYRPCLSGADSVNQGSPGISNNSEAICVHYLASLTDIDHCFSWLNLLDLVCRNTGVKRVVLASVHHDAARIVAISGQTKVDYRREMIDELQQAMLVVHEEGIPSFFPINQSMGKSGNGSITPGLMVLQDRSWLMLPMKVLGKQFVILLERSLGQHFSVHESEKIASQLNPLLVAALIHRETNQSLPGRIKAQLMGKCVSLLDRKSRYVVQGLMLLILMLILFIPVDYRVSASASIDAADNHVLVAPVDGILSSVGVSAGDVVTEGQLLATFDDRELALQAQQWLTEKQKNNQEYTMALAKHDRIELSRLRADSVRVEAQLELVRQRQESIQIRAPIDGVVLSGNWDDSLGAALKSGEKLFEVGTLEDHSLVLSVPERSIDLVRPSQSIALRMAASPTQKIIATVDSISPVAIAKQGVNTIKVFATLSTRHSGLRPGMQGVAKILVGQESRALQWIAGLRSRVVIWAWKLGLIK